MGAFNLQIGFDEESLKRLAAFENFGGILTARIMDGLGRSADAVRGEAQVFMWSEFKHPTGPMEDSLHWEYNSPRQVQITSDMPYARRLNYGFTGMTDSINRYYVEWPEGVYSVGYHWAEAALLASQEQIEAIFQAELEVAAHGIS